MPPILVPKPIRSIALYLPQFHPIPENDAWWGPGFTEWTNAAKARPLFPGHVQPNIPGELGFYDLRLAETREAQARLALEYGIEGFAYYHYWFAGRQLLERPFSEVLASGQPALPFCLMWANQTWAGVWHGAPDRILIEQTYPGPDDHRRHFEVLLPAFTDARYLRVAGKPLFGVVFPADLPEPRAVAEQWQALAIRAGLPGLYLVCMTHDPALDPRSIGFDAAIVTRLHDIYGEPSTRLERLKARVRASLYRRGVPMILPYVDMAAAQIPPLVPGVVHHPCVIPNWDNTPRSGRRGHVFYGSTPDRFRNHVMDAVARIRATPDREPLLFVKSWNEWAEGNYLEPDRRFGRAYLEAMRDGIAASS
jgi:lipopolysaccharide biosynthesis protein